MSAQKIDVLAVIVSAKPHHCGCGYPRCSKNALATELTEVHAIVAGLIDASNHIAELWDAMGAPQGPSRNKLHEILSRIGRTP